MNKHDDVRDPEAVRLGDLVAAKAHHMNWQRVNLSMCPDSNALEFYAAGYTMDGVETVYRLCGYKDDSWVVVVSTGDGPTRQLQASPEALRALAAKVVEGLKDDPI